MQESARAPEANIPEVSVTEPPQQAQGPPARPEAATPGRPCPPHRVAQQGVGVGGFAQLAQLAIPMQQRRLLAALAHLHGGPGCPAPELTPHRPLPWAARRRYRRRSEAAFPAGARSAGSGGAPPPAASRAPARPRPRRPRGQWGLRSAAGRRTAPQSALCAPRAPRIQLGNVGGALWERRARPPMRQRQDCGQSEAALPLRVGGGTAAAPKEPTAPVSAVYGVECSPVSGAGSPPGPSPLYLIEKRALRAKYIVWYC